MSGPRGDDGAGGTLARLLATLPQRGRLGWIGLRPARGAAMETPAEATFLSGDGPASGLLGDRYAGRDGRRQVTLVQAEHLPALASMLGGGSIAPELLRRNLVVSGINLLALKGRRFRVGDALLEHTGACHPCSRMEALLGPGGYNAMRGHGGITARVVVGARVGVGAVVSVEGFEPTAPIVGG